MNKLTYLIFLFFFFISCESKSQEKNNSSVTLSKSSVGGGCDGCEIMYVGMPLRLNSTDTSVGWPNARVKLVVRGTVYQPDGRTPAPNVIVYYWHTDEQGLYSKNSVHREEGTLHGARRGWVKTGTDGTYTLCTNRPGPYPSHDLAAHIHLAIKEPNLSNEYYVDDLVFDDDRLLTTAQRKVLENRGGSGLLRPRKVGGVQVAQHDIILGLHIPNYPGVSLGKKGAGLSIGEESPSFTPYHAWGPDKGSKACPVCKYGRNYGILYFAGTKEPLDSMKTWLVLLENLSKQQGERLKVYLICETGGQPELMQRKIEQLGQELNLQAIALTWVPTFGDKTSEVYLNRIDAGDVNTFIVYKNRIIIETYTNLVPTTANFQKLTRKVP